jgi:dGTP triphosphohydrolase
MIFTDKLRKDTMNTHRQVDRHVFVVEMKENKEKAIKYIKFNEKCIYEIQKTLEMKDNDLQNMLYRDIQNSCLNNNSLNMENLLERCRQHPLCHAYMFYLGLLSGGNLLRKYIPVEYTGLLDFQEEPQYVIQRFKTYLNTHVVDQDNFINEVNASYKLIQKCFDEFI